MENSVAKDVFISYKAEEYAEALWVKTTLETNGISCWLAPGSIPGGSSYAVEIPAAIRACKAFVLLLSEKAQSSKWVPRELDQAINENKIILPFMLENCALKDDFNFYLTNVQRYAAYENKAAAMEKMVREIKAVLALHGNSATDRNGPEEQSVPVKTEEPRPEQKIKKAKTSAPKKEKTGSSKKKKNLILVLSLVLAAAAVLAGLFIYDEYYDDTGDDTFNSFNTSDNQVLIAGESYFKNETYLSLDSVTLTEDDIKNISELKELNTLYLDNCTIEASDIGALLNSKIYSLRFTDCGLTAQQFASLDFSEMKIYSMNLRGNPEIKSLDSLASQGAWMTSLDVSNTGVSDLSFLSSFASLETLTANGNEIPDLSPLSGCTKLKILRVNDNGLTSLAGLENAIALTDLSAGSNEIESLDGLQNATRLSYVFLDDNRISDISVFGKSAKTLKSLYLRNNAVDDLSPLASCTSLLHFNADSNRITSLAPLSDCSVLEVLSVAGNQIDSTAGIGGTRAFRYVNLADNRLTSAWVDQQFHLELKDDETPVVFDLSGNQISNLSLSVPAYYKILNLAGNPLADFSPIYALKGTYLAVDYADSADFEKMKTFSEIHLLDCPLDRRMDVSDILGSYNVNFEDSATFDFDTVSRANFDNVDGFLVDREYCK